MVSVAVFEFGGMRCQPLRRALSFFFKVRYTININEIIRIFT
ncbi:iron transporter [Vibrio cholerae]